MKKNFEDKVNRMSFIGLTLDSPEEAAKYLEEKAEEIRNSHGTHNRVLILKEILFLGERTIYNDYSKT